MGAQSSKNNEIIVQLDKSFYRPGETVNGGVHLNIYSIFPSSYLYLKIKGVETCTIKNILGKNEVKKEQIYYENVVLKDYNSNQVPIGQYTFPFNFELWNKLPCTFRDSNSQFDVQIEYYMQNLNKNINYVFIIKIQILHIQAQMPSLDSDTKTLRNRTYLEIREIQPNNSIQVQKVIINPKVCCCLSKGIFTVQSKINSPYTRIDKNMEIQLDLDATKCKLPLKNIDIEIIQETTVYQTKKDLLKIRKQVQRTTEGVCQGMLLIGENSRNIILDLQKDKKQIKNWSPSSSGKSFKCEHKLYMTFKFSSLLNSFTEQVIIPLQIQLPIQDSDKKNIAPNDWKPQIFPPKQINFGEPFKCKDQISMDEMYYNIMENSIIDIQQKLI